MFVGGCGAVRAGLGVAFNSRDGFSSPHLSCRVRPRKKIASRKSSQKEHPPSTHIDKRVNDILAFLELGKHANFYPIISWDFVCTS